MAIGPTVIMCKNIKWFKECLGASNGPYFFRGAHPRRVFDNEDDVGRLMIEITPAKKKLNVPAEWVVWIERMPPYSDWRQDIPKVKIARGEASGVARAKQAAMEWIDEAEDCALLALVPKE